MQLQSRTLPRPTFLAFWVHLEVHLGAHLAPFLLILEGPFFDQILDWILEHFPHPGGIDPGLSWGGGFLAGDPFTGLTSNKG